jgi:hypothetical protein
MISENPNAPGKHDRKTIGPQEAAAKKNPNVGGPPLIPSKIVPSKNGSDKPCHCRYEPTPRWKRWLEAIVALSVIAYAIITGFMWRDSHKNFVIDEQAWLSVESIPPGEIKEGTPIQAAVFIRDTGKTPAKKIASDWGIWIVRNTESVSFDYSQNHTMSFTGVLNTNAVSVVQVLKSGDPLAPPVTKEQAESLLAGRMYLVVYGRVRYADIFGETHRVRFCNWKGYYVGAAGGTYAAAGCTAYNDTGNGEPPKD